MGTKPRGGRSALILLVCLFSYSIARGQSNVLREQISVGEKRLRLTTTVLTESTLHEIGSVERSAQTQISLSPSLKIDDNNQLRATLAVIHLLTGSQDTELSNLNLFWSQKALEISQTLSLIPKLGGIVPTNQKDREENSLLTSIYVSPLLVHSVSRWTLIWTPTLTQNFHRYDRNFMGIANVQTSLTNELMVEWSRGPISLGLAGGLSHAWTYQGTSKEYFYLDESLTYQANRQWSLMVGHTNSGDVLQANGRDRNVSFYDRNSSTVYFGLRAIY